MIDHDLLAQFWRETFFGYVEIIGGAVIGVLVAITIVVLFDYLFLKQEGDD